MPLLIFVHFILYRSGMGAVVALWEKLMLVIGPDKDYISYPSVLVCQLLNIEHRIGNISVYS